MSDTVQRLADNLADVRRRMASAAERAGRRAESVTLVAVTKYVGLEATRALVAAGCLDLGESRPQDLWTKAAGLAESPVRWHLIGHLQRNKVRRTLPLVALLHAGDSRRLLETLHQEAAGEERRIPVLLEINISGDAAKHGFSPAELDAELPNLRACERLEIRGLMAMSGLASDAEQTRAEFRRVRELRDRIRERVPEWTTFGELSLGMSGDFEIAIEEGATLVRVGSALFAGVEP